MNKQSDGSGVFVQCTHDATARRVIVPADVSPGFENEAGPFCPVEAMWCGACGAIYRRFLRAEGAWERPTAAWDGASPKSSASIALRQVVAGLAIRDEAFRSLLAALEREKALARKAIGVCSDLERLQSAIKEVLDAHAKAGT